ncbi:mitochondrial import inner membrane translocase subunit TIM50-C-like [Agrilus planipennis]|uniref:Mitochondrial import inner membrane translocase subunit TIM50 n=1 Tax=Agrilus planipennis TaxID=224129 RepID=A0A1W4W3I2_AGRPL|nr:mitochondrial import inner membrane translocase subunit TIM50-C-like [Agrilus planipennis]
MFRAVSRSGILKNALKISSGVYLVQNEGKAVLNLTSAHISKAFFSDSKEVKPATPLANLLGKENIPTADKEKKEEEDEQKQRDAAWRTMKYTFIAFGFSFTVLGGYLVFELGKPVIGEDGLPVQDEFAHLAPWKQYLYRTLKELDYYKRLIKEPSRDKLLPDPLKYPYYQPPYTLVLELTDLLVHPDWTYQTGWRFKKRPGLNQFLESLTGLYEIVVYTAEQGMTVFPLMEALDPKNLISYKLVRDATHFVDGHHVKNLDKLNRDLSKVIVVDWNMDSVKFHPDNVLRIPKWVGNDDDTTLFDLAGFLRTVATSEIDDVRDVLKYYKEFDDPLAVFRERQRKLMEQQEAEREAKKLQTPPPVKRWTPSIFNRSF